MTGPTLHQVIEVLRRGCSFTGANCFSVFEPLTEIVDFNTPWGLFVMGQGCDEPHFQGKTSLFYFVRAETESDDTLHCYEPSGLRTSFVICDNQRFIDEVREYKKRPKVQEFEAAAIADARERLKELIRAGDQGRPAA